MKLFFLIFFILLVVQRLSELFVARRHEIWLKSQGAQEHGAGHYPWIVMIMALFLIALPTEFFILKRAMPSYWTLLLFLLLATQALRIWSMRSLGKRWTTRIWILPHQSPLRSGPYRYLNHPNYVVVVLELILIPWIFGCYFTLFIFIFLYLLWLRERLRVENACLYGRN